MTRKSGLGRGLDALITDEGLGAVEGGVYQIPVEAISRNPRQPRAEISSESLEELTSSIRENGILQPLILAPGEQSGTYTLIAGERRLQAARQVGLQKVPAIVRSASEQQYLELALVENLIRTDLTPLETAEAYRQLADDFGLSHEKIAHNVGKSRVSITNTLRLLKLPVEAKIALQDEQISEGHARALLTLPTKQSQIAALQTILRYSLNVRQTEELVRKLTGQRQVEIKSPSQPPEFSALEQRLREFLGTKVILNQGRKGGTLTIHYYSDEELDALVGKIMGEMDNNSRAR